MTTKPQPNFQPSLRWLLSSPTYFFAFGFGSGLIRPAPGTWGTLAGWGLFYPLFYLLPNVFLLWALLFGAFIYGCFICNTTGKALGVADYGGIVWDEIVAIWLVLTFTPYDWLWHLAAFGIFRFFDIVKPPPIRWFDQRLKHGFGVMFDDIVAAIYSIIVLHVLTHYINT